MAGSTFSTSAPLIHLKSLGFLYPSFCVNLNNKPCWKAVMLLRLSIWGGRWGDMHNVCGGGGYGPYHSKPPLCIFSIKIIKKKCARSESNILSRNYFSLPLEIIILRNRVPVNFLIKKPSCCGNTMLWKGGWPIEWSVIWYSTLLGFIWDIGSRNPISTPPCSWQYNHNKLNKSPFSFLGRFHKSMSWADLPNGRASLTLIRRNGMTEHQIKTKSWSSTQLCIHSHTSKAFYHLLRPTLLDTSVCQDHCSKSISTAAVCLKTGFVPTRSVVWEMKRIYF